VRIRYSRWDGTQKLDALDADDLLAAMSDDLLADGDPWRALRRLFHRGAPRPDGRPMPGLGELLQRLRGQRQQRLDRYDLGSALDERASSAASPRRPSAPRSSRASTASRPTPRA